MRTFIILHTERFSGRPLQALKRPDARRLLGDLSDDPYDQAGPGDRENDAGNPASADADQVAQKSADKSADHAEHCIPKKALGTARHDFVGGKSAHGSDTQ